MLTFKVLPELRDEASEYEVTLNAYDGGLTGRLDVTVTITDVNEPPTISGRVGVDFTENGTGTVEMYSATDPDVGATQAWSLAGADGSDFAITNGVLTFINPPDYDMPTDDSRPYNEYLVTVQVNDGANTVTRPVTVRVLDVNEAPEVMGETSVARDENSDLPIDVYQATDPEGRATSWLSLMGADALLFTIDEYGELTFAEPPDYESSDIGRDKAYNVIVRASDDDNLIGELAVTVTVTPVDEPPVVDGPRSVMDYPENSPTTTVVGRYMATDPEGAGVTWSDLSGNDAGKFELDSDGDLTFKTSPNYEQKSEYEVTLNAYDGRFTGRLDVTVTIADENEQPMVTSSSGTGAFSIAENSGTTVGDFDATDPEGHAVTWSLASGGDSRFFEIDETNAALSFKESEFNENEIPDYESTGLGSDKAYNVTVRATEADDGDTQTRELWGRLAVTVRITNVNEAPTITGNQTPSVAENTTAVVTYRATDPEQVPVTWSLQDGAGVFTISSAGALAFKNTTPPNYEDQTEHTVTVHASDGTNTTDYPVTVTVTDVNEPEVLTLSDPSPLIGLDFTAAFEGTGDNVDNVQPPTWAWARSAMGSSSGWMPITDATNATYEPTGDDRERYLRVTVSYNDGHGAKTLSKVSDFTTKPDSGTNTPPAFPSPLFTGGATGLSVRENAGVRTVVGVAPQATDMQGGGLTYSLAVDGFTTDAPFEINATSRQIRVVRAVLNHERQDTYGVTVTVKDEYNDTATATFDITIEDVNEPPVAVADPSVTTEEDMPVTFDVLGNDTDPDEGDTLTVMTITTQPRRGRVVADPGTQMLTYTPAKDDHDTYTFMYTARDDDPVRMLTSPAARVTVTVNPVNDAPEFATEMTTRTVSESAQQGDDRGHEGSGDRR